MLHLNRTFISLVGAVAIAIGMAAPALAQDVPTTSDALTVTLAGGVLTFAIKVDSQLSQIRYSHSDGFTSATGGAFTVFVKDDRNTEAGYVINLAASDFLRDDGVKTIDLNLGQTTLAVGAATSVTRTAGSDTEPLASAVTRLMDIPAPILTAGQGNGNGHYTAAGYSLSLSGVPAGTISGNYTSILTVSSTAGP